MNDITSNLAHLRDAIATAAHRAGRNLDEIQLIAVSKTHPIESIETALRAGQRVFGESTVQESLVKIAHFAQRPVEWHFIGHLQSNKVRFVPGNFAWIHSVDSLKLARRLSRFAQERHATINALIEVNVTRDPGKHGVLPNAVLPLLDQLQREAFPGIAFRGLMTVGPYHAGEADVRRTFATLRALRDDCARRMTSPNFDQLSMGMSGDYVEAIKEGATLLRIGTAIFGERDYRSESKA